MREGTTAMSHEQVVVERVKGFLKWNPDRFHVLDQAPAALRPILDHLTDSLGSVEPSDLWGWRRGQEYWVKPVAFREQLCGDEFDPVETARTLKALDLLRVQDSDTFQCSVKVKGATPRAYVIGEAIFEWKPAVSGGGFRSFRAREPGFISRQNTPDFRQSGDLASQDPNNSGDLAPRNPVDLATLLQSGSEAALRKAIEVLAMSPDPDDRHYATVLRAQSTFGNTMLNVQLRVDEARLRTKQADELLPALMESLKIEKERLTKVEFRRGFVGGEPIGMGALADDEPSA
jgi:hypothetical protein